MSKLCLICNKEFKNNSRNSKKTCSKECVVKQHKLIQRQVRDKSRPVLTCSECGKEYTKTVGLKKTVDVCSIECSRWGKRTENNLGELMIKLKKSRTMIDFSLGNKLIEFYGTYWHADPKKYADDAMIFKRRKNYITAAEIRALDAAREKELIDMGFKIHIVWERDYNSNPEKVVQECLNFLEQK